VAGASALFLPAYSPIEEAFSKIKLILSKIEVRTHEALVEAIWQAVRRINRRDVLGWFGHCGYDVFAAGMKTAVERLAASDRLRKVRAISEEEPTVIIY
jgi:hypothetical protein